MSINSLKRNLLSVPLLGEALRAIITVIRLPRYQEMQLMRSDQTAKAIEKISDKTEKNTQLTEEFTQKYSTQQKTLDGVQKQLHLLEKGLGTSAKKSSTTTSNSVEQLFADDHLLDLFYTNFEDKFRGDERSVSEMLKIYIPYFKKPKSLIDFSNNPVLDIGCGRGEMLKLLSEHRVKAEGLDINIDMVERANKKGLKASQGDALSFLEKTSSQNYGAITGFHIAEHIPFGSLLRIIKEAHRCLANEGFLILETPNPENVIVGSSTFYLDPSHLHPLPPILMSFVFETCGFRNIEILRLHPDTSGEITKGLPPEISSRFFGPRDYAVIGYK